MFFGFLAPYFALVEFYLRQRGNNFYLFIFFLNHFFWLIVLDFSFAFSRSPRIQRSAAVWHLDTWARLCVEP